MENTTVEEYMTITRINYESGNEKGRIELKGQFLIKLRDNAFSGTNGEDAIKHIENFLEIVDSLNIPNVSNNQLRIRVFPFSLTGAASKWWEDESIGSIATWEEGHYNTGDLPGFIREGNLTRYEDYEWYDTIEDSELKEEALINKIILEESMNMMEELSDDKWFDEHELIEDDDDDIGDLEDYLIQKDHPYYVNEDEERSKERRYKLLRVPYVKPPTCKTEKFEVVKYSFGTAEEYVTITEYEYDFWVRTEEKVSQVYHGIFRKNDKGWFISRTN
ncbi:hypothetical protein Tco_0403696 [Tanacetum coccineum]